MRTMLFSQSKDIQYALSSSFIGILGGAFGLAFSNRPGQGGGFAFQPAGELLASIGPGVGQTLSSLDILKSEFSDICMRIRRDHASTLSLLRYGREHQRGIPLIALQGETFGQSYLETVVGIFWKLIGLIADER